MNRRARPSSGRARQPKWPKNERPDWDVRAEEARRSQLPTKRPRWLDDLDDRLTWPAGEKPDLEIGDRIVVAWHKIRLVTPSNERVARDEPAIWIEITGYGRSKRGEHSYRYRIHGDDPGAYMAPTNQGDEHGHTSSPANSIDPDCPVLPLRDNGYITERDHNEREIKRLERLKVRHLEQLSQTDQPGTMARITTSINDLDRQLAALRHRRGEAERRVLRSAA